ncbi:MAG: SRPBCC family protein [Bacteroidetes bacterium]|nr:SRPBCC family protein [Bacteroidota bacterium]
MKKVLKWAGITVLALAGIYFLIALFAPSHYKVERTRTLAASPEAVYSQISQLKNWNAWSAWARMDSTTVYTYEGTDGAVGSVMKWKGDPEKTGEGIMEITELVPNAKIAYKLTFVDWNSVSTGAFTLTALGDSTRVNWTNEGDIPFLMRTLSLLFMDMDAMMGPDFEKGLKNLDDLLATMTPAFPEIPDYEIQQLTLPAAHYIGVRFDTLITAVDSTLFSSAYGQLGVYSAENKLEMTGAPVCITYKWDETAGRCELVAAFPVALNAKPAKQNGIESIQLQGGNALLIDYYGRYDNIWMAHMAMDKYMLEHSLKASVSIEEYVTDPTTVPTYDSVLTKLYYVLE